MSHNRELQILKPIHLKPVLHNKRSHHNEKPKHHNEEQDPATATRGSLHAATKTQHSGGGGDKKRQAQRITHRLRALLQYFQSDLANRLLPKGVSFPANTTS